MDCLSIVVFVLTYLISFASAKSPPTSSKTIIVQSITACPSQHRLPTKLPYFAFYNKHGMSVVNATANFTETLQAPLSIRVEGERRDIHRSQCTSIPGINYDKFCSVFGESYYGATYFGKTEPPITGCPIMKVWKDLRRIHGKINSNLLWQGTYMMKNVVIDHEEILKQVPFAIGRYKFKNVIYDNHYGKKRAVMCWICEFQVQTTSRRGAWGSSSIKVVQYFNSISLTLIFTSYFTKHSHHNSSLITNLTQIHFNIYTHNTPLLLFSSQ